MTNVFVDTHVLLYAVDETEPAKQVRAREWLTVCWQRRCGRVSTQVLHEFYWNARRRFRDVVSADEARAQVRRYQAWHPWVVDTATIETAWSIETRYQLSYWDALMVAAAQQQGCVVLLTEDLQHGQRLDAVRVVDPFRIGPERLDDTA